MTQARIDNVSETALWVAHFRAEEGRRADALFHDYLAERLAGERGTRIAKEMGAEAIMAWVMSVRTVAIDRLITEKLGDIDLVLNIGAGLDTRPYRMDLPASLRWVEADFPHMIDYKNEKLSGEKPRCQLRREAVDLTDAGARRAFLAKIGAEASRVLVITEGVIIYLKDEDAGALADDLHAVPSIRYWVQDYNLGGLERRTPPRWKEKMGDAYFKFSAKDWFGFFAGHGWKLGEKIEAYDEGVRLGRRFPVPFPWNWVMRFVPEEKRRAALNVSGYCLLERS